MAKQDTSIPGLVRRAAWGARANAKKSATAPSTRAAR